MRRQRIVVKARPVRVIADDAVKIIAPPIALSFALQGMQEKKMLCKSKKHNKVIILGFIAVLCFH